MKHDTRYLLAVDVGNTHIEIGLFQKMEFITSWRITTGVHRTEDEFLAYIAQLLSLKGIHLNQIIDVAISSVVPDVTQIFNRLSERYFHRSPLAVDHTLDLGIQVDYHPPSSVGADRLCNAVSGYERYGGPLIIVDFGTATTFDVISKDGVYLGGAIAPGVETTAWGLAERASKLPRISLEYPEHVIGKSTEESMQAGILLGSVKMVDGLLEEMIQQIDGEVTVIGTGGLAALIAERSQFIRIVEPDLVLDGLVRIYFRNNGNRTSA